MDESGEQSLLTLKPSIHNALFPYFMKNILYSLFVAVPLFLIIFGLNKIFTLPISNTAAFSWLTTLALVFSFLPLIFEALILHNTRYLFFKSHIVTETEVINLVRHSARYDQITNIITEIYLWDKIPNEGFLVLHTEDNSKEHLK